MRNKIKTSVRLKNSLASIVTLCIGCFLSSIIVISGFVLFFHENMSIGLVYIMVLITCVLSMIIGSVLLWYTSKFITEPIIKLSEGVRKVSDGDFSIVINNSSQDEIGCLVDNFNKMTKELNSMDYMRRDFMSNVSHEVKTPVAAITGFAEMLEEGGLSKEDEKEYLSLLYKESFRLSRLCDNMLNMSRLDNQQILNNKKEFYVDEQIRRCIILLEEKWVEKRINYKLKLNKCKVVSDYDFLYQVWINIIDNAIKFSQNCGVISISANYDENKRVVIKIKDYGTGIEKNKISKIFDKFYMGDKSRKKEGNGLGLSIVKRIIELIGGEIICNSKENEGTEFIIII
ncbi:HAMP domain-containing histidine kinase [Clostridium felsineum]|uniref:HAMP domain-containing sensor histidine kinase n=1 Tax=Clostridium felsineum TaxID=36839 RepID=UPI00098C6E76|nr:HAMP domain-containing sensor histidine kinase [Clostridium felsineum]MCR3758114.1 HAMP domain-containing histidine kinase [Clostridium felsineum]URZ01109.1 Adaptive-response sensory-kinase SasA [Clostridium felsineum]URZ15849.1 Adaptive-response sensory-kinase SasA [Clostridium felsineum DSM 794]